MPNRSNFGPHRLGRGPLAYTASAINRFLGQVATRCTINNGTQDGNTYAVSSFHYMRASGVTALKVGFANWYVLSNPGATEDNSVSSMGVKCGIEYPLGTFTPFLFGGSASSHSVAPGALDFTDSLTVSVPVGSLFKLHQQRANSPFYADDIGNKRAVSFGDAVELTSTDKTLTGGEIDSGDTKSFFPAAIVGMTTQKSVACIGDSICAGQADTVDDSSGDRGILARGVGATLPYINLGIASDQISAFNSNHTKRMALAKLCTHIASNYSVNDVGDGSATILSNIQAVAAAFSPWPFYQTTMTPQSSGAWTLANGSDQSTGGFNAAHTGVNTGLRAGLSGVNLIEVCNTLEMSPQYSGKWIADGTTNKYTGDGTHPTTAAYLLVASAIQSAIASGLFADGNYSYM